MYDKVDRFLSCKLQAVIDTQVTQWSIKGNSTRFLDISAIILTLGSQRMVDPSDFTTSILEMVW